MNVNQFKKSGGYVGLLLLVLSLSIVIFFIWYAYFRDVVVDTPEGMRGDKTLFDQNKNATKSAENIKILIEEQNRESVR